MGMTFKSEEDRVAEMGKVTDDVSLDQEAKLARIAEIEGATIEVGEAVAGTEKKDEPPKPPDTQPDEELTFKVKRSQLLGHKTLDDLIKGHGELEETLDRQGKYIKEHIEGGKQADPELLSKLADTEARLKEATEKLAAASTKPDGTTEQPKPATVADMATVRAELKRLNDLQDGLDKELEDDETIEFELDFKKRQREVTRGLAKTQNLLADLTEKALSEVGKTSQMREEIVERDKKQSEDAKKEQTAREFHINRLKAFDETLFPEYKLSERAELVWDKALQWRNDICLAVLGRKPQNADEADQVMAKLEAKDADAIQKCNTMRVAITPTIDVKKLIVQAQNFDFQQGYRFDKVNGKWYKLPDGQGQYPTLREATIARRIAEGDFDNMKDRNFQAGAEAALEVAGRREKGAVELSGREHLGAQEMPVEQAISDMAAFDVVGMTTSVMNGDLKPLEEYNKLLRAAGEKEITVEELRKSLLF